MRTAQQLLGARLSVGQEGHSDGDHEQSWPEVDGDLQKGLSNDFDLLSVGEVVNHASTIGARSGQLKRNEPGSKVSLAQRANSGQLNLFLRIE